MSHSALAMTTEGTPLGLMHLDVWGMTPEEDLPPLGGPVPEEQRESQKWLRGLASASAALPPGTTGIMLADREADIFRLFAAERPANLQLLIRAAQNRNVEHLSVPGSSEESQRPTRMTGKLFAVAATGEVLGTMVVLVPRRSAREGLAAMPERAARLTLRAREAWIQPRGKRQVEQRVWLIEAREEEPPDNVPGIHWVLLSTLPVTDLEAAVTWWAITLGGG